MRSVEMLQNVSLIDLSLTLESPATGTWRIQARCGSCSETGLISSTCHGKSWMEVVRPFTMRCEECLTFLDQTSNEASRRGVNGTNPDWDTKQLREGALPVLGTS